MVTNPSSVVAKGCNEASVGTFNMARQRGQLVIECLKDRPTPASLCLFSSLGTENALSQKDSNSGCWSRRQER